MNVFISYGRLLVATLAATLIASTRGAPAFAGQKSLAAAHAKLRKHQAIQA